MRPSLTTLSKPGIYLETAARGVNPSQHTIVSLDCGLVPKLP